MHASPRDARALLDRRTENTDALFVEGRSDVIQLKHYTMGYVLFLIGYLSLEVIYRTSDWLHEVATNGEGWSIEEAGRNAGLEVDSEIDAELHEVWSLAEDSGRTTLFGLALLMFAYAILNSIYGNSFLGIPAGLLSVIITIGTPLGFSGFIVILLSSDSIRDEIMADSIIESSENEDYSEVLVLCGDKHVPELSAKLRSEGWTVEEHQSKHPLSKLPNPLNIV